MNTVLKIPDRRLRAPIIFVGAIILLVLSATSVSAQTDAPPSPSPEMHYYDFWPGTWHRIVNGRGDETASSFQVKRIVHAAAFEEEWYEGVDAKGKAIWSRAIRAWDQINKRWMFAWISDNALFQVWEGRKYGDRWYIVREFETNGRRFLSCQAWWPDGPNRVVRVSERSFDGGTTWELRFREEYGRVQDETSACQSPEARALDFLIGRWEGDERQIEGGKETIVSTSEIQVEKIFGGCALRETWEVKEGGKKLFNAIVLRSYDAGSKKWLLSYVDDALNHQFYEGRNEMGKWRFFRERMVEGKPVLVRITWTQVTKDSIDQRIERSSDNGNTWVLRSVVSYARKK